VKTAVLLFFLGTLLFLNILVWQEVFNFSEIPYLKVIFFDVGQGDAIFIETSQKHQILIDGGPDSTVLERLATVMPFWDRSIDLIILTHPEYDHFNGLIEVLKRYQIEAILWTGVVRDTAEYREWLKLIQKEKAKIYIAKAGQKITTNSGFMVIEILYPFENLEGQTLKNTNNSSIISRITFKENSFLFTGDAHKEVELILVDEFGERLKSDVLKLGHHGSKTSSAREFVEQVSPEIAVISVGKDNRYGHPHQEVLETLADYGITVLRTDRDGDIKIISDGKNLKIFNFQ